MKYLVTVGRLGYIEVEANSADEAMSDVNENATYDDINWVAGWRATSAEWDKTNG